MRKENTAAPACRARTLTRRLQITILAAYILVVSSLIFTGNTLARYTSEASGSSTAQIAAFDVAYDEAGAYDANKQPTQQSIVLTTSSDPLAPGENVRYQIKLTNNSDVKVDYTLKAVSYGNLPLTFSFDSGSGTMNYDEVKIVTLTVTWPAGQNSAAYANTVDAVKVTVNFDQVD